MSEPPAKKVNKGVGFNHDDGKTKTSQKTNKIEPDGQKKNISQRAKKSGKTGPNPLAPQSNVAVKHVDPKMKIKMSA